jgi:putative transposase
MPRTARASPGGVCYHAMNRGNAKACVFHDDHDYEYFVDLIARSSERIPMRILAFSLMPTHFHFSLWPYLDGDIGRWMHWLLTSHVQRYRLRWGGDKGHIWQGRFKAFPAQDDSHLLSVLRYIERNPLRAHLVARAEDWQWSSLRWWGDCRKPKYLHEGPVQHPKDWLSWVNTPQTEEELTAIRNCIARGRPLGNEEWVKRTAKELRLESSIRPRGRPSKKGRKGDIPVFHHQNIVVADDPENRNVPFSP